MRLKQLLGLFALLAILCTVTVAASSQLTTVSTSAKGNSTIVTVHANGSFTHNEYRPADNLLLVDMTGISPGKLQDKEQDLNLPGVKSYRVLSYKGASGTEVTRLEIALADANEVQVTETKGGLLLRVSGKGEAPVTATAPATAPATPAPKVERASMTSAPAPKPSAKTVPANVPEGMGSIRNIAVSHGASGLEVQIHGATSAKAMKLSNPDRVVLDFENSVPAVRTKNILVNSPELKDIRVGQFQNDPPVTRVVMDMKVAQEFDLVPGDGMLTVKFHGSSKASAAPAKPESAVAPAPLKPAIAQNSTPAYAMPVSTSTAKAAEVKPVEQKPAVASAQAQPAVF